jgi:hypothetical protein
MRSTSLLLLALVVLAGCWRTVVQDNPSASQQIIYASAYSTDDCQAKMNAAAGKDVQMIHDTSRVGFSILSLGIAPAHQCIGIAKDADTARSPGPANP